MKELAGIAIEGEALRVGCLTRIAALAGEPLVQQQWSGLALAAGQLATPEIRNQATVGGKPAAERRRRALLSTGRALLSGRWGGSGEARGGDHSVHACIDLGPCIAPHPSTLAVALLAYEAEIEVAGGERWPLAALYGDGSDRRRTHRLPPGALLLAVHVPRTMPGERAAFHRTSSRSRAGVADRRGGGAAGGDGWGLFASRGWRWAGWRTFRCGSRGEQRLLAQAPTAALLADAAGLAGAGAKPPPGAAYKLELLRATVDGAS